MTSTQGIPDNVGQEAPQAPSAPTAQAGSTATQPSTTAAASSTDPAPTAEGDDAPINLFEAAAQAGRGGTGARGAAGRSGAAAAGAGAGAGAGAEGGAAAAGNLGNLDFLRNNPQFQQLRQIVQTQPRMLEPILQQVAGGNPQLAQIIGQNPEQFLQLLSEDADEDAPLPPGATQVSVTEEERAAIERVRFFFPR